MGPRSDPGNADCMVPRTDASPIRWVISKSNCRHTTACGSPGVRTGDHDEALREANAMLDAATLANDVEAVAVARRIVGLSLHVSGDQAAAREQVEASLRWHESHPSHAAFRFGLGQHAAGLAYLARILWLQGDAGQAVSTAELAVDHATALDHACTLCCVLAEGMCMVSMLNRDIPKVEASARTLIETAARHGLQFWKTYGELFEFWALARAEPTRVTVDRTVALLATLERTCFGFHYTPMLMDLVDDERLARPSRDVIRAAADRAGQRRNATGPRRSSCASQPRRRMACKRTQ